MYMYLRFVSVLATAHEKQVGIDTQIHQLYNALCRCVYIIIIINEGKLQDHEYKTVVRVAYEA